MGCLTKAFAVALGVVAAIGLTSRGHKDRPDWPRREHAAECANRGALAPLYILADGSVTFLGQHYDDRRRLAARLEALAKRAPQMQVRLVPDRRTPYGDVVAVLTLAQNAGMGCLGFTGIERSP